MKSGVRGVLFLVAVPIAGCTAPVPPPQLADVPINLTGCPGERVSQQPLSGIVTVDHLKAHDAAQTVALNRSEALRADCAYRLRALNAWIEAQRLAK